VIFQRNENFEVIHSGRGGKITFNYNGSINSFNIEIAENGNFIIFTGKDSKFKEVRVSLRKFLDSTDRKGWFIET